MKIKRSVFLGLLGSMFVILCWLFAVQNGYAQDRINIKDVHIIDAAPVPQVMNATIGTRVPGSRSLYYWVVSKDASGNTSTPSGPFYTKNAPATVTASNPITVVWQPVKGAVTYDVLRTTTIAAPSGACDCAVVTSSTATSISDKAEALNAYTVSDAGSDFIVTNERIAGVSTQVHRYAGNRVFGIDKNGLNLPSMILGPSDSSVPFKTTALRINNGDNQHAISVYNDSTGKPALIFNPFSTSDKQNNIWLYPAEDQQRISLTMLQKANYTAVERMMTLSCHGDEGVVNGDGSPQDSHCSWYGNRSKNIGATDPTNYLHPHWKVWEVNHGDTWGPLFRFESRMMVGAENAFVSYPTEFYPSAAGELLRTSGFTNKPAAFSQGAFDSTFNTQTAIFSGNLYWDKFAPGVYCWNGFCVVHTQADHGFVSGDHVTIAGNSLAEANGTWIITDTYGTKGFGFAKPSGNQSYIYGGTGTATVEGKAVANIETQASGYFRVDPRWNNTSAGAIAIGSDGCVRVISIASDSSNTIKTFTEAQLLALSRMAVCSDGSVTVGNRVAAIRGSDGAIDTYHDNDGAGNYNAGRLWWVSDGLNIGIQKAGTATGDYPIRIMNPTNGLISFGTNNTVRWQIAADGTFVPLTDGVGGIGYTGSLRPDYVSVKSNFRAGGNTGMTVVKTVKGSDGNNCTMTFTGGILTATTCP